MTSQFQTHAIFANNRGTPLVLLGVRLTLKGNITLEGNTGETGGGLYIDRDTTLNIVGNGTVSFLNNEAVFGGAMYIEVSQTSCFFHPESSLSLIFNGNSANIGNSIFLSNDWSPYGNDEKCIEFQAVTDIAMLPASISGNSTIDYAYDDGG